MCRQGKSDVAKRNIQGSVISFQAQVWSIKTLVDGGLNVTLALSDKNIEQVARLLQCKKDGALLEIAAVAVKEKFTKVDDETKKGAKRSGARVDRRRFADG